VNVHVEEFNMNPCVKTLQPQSDYRLLLEFANGEQRVFDASSYLNRGVFIALQNPSVFKMAKVVAGSVEWPGEIDLSYDTLYLESKPLTQGHAA
jgi:hypothetical protein